MVKAKAKDYVIRNGAWFDPETKTCKGVGDIVSFTAKQAKVYGMSNLSLKTDDVAGNPATDPTGEPQGADSGTEGGDPTKEPEGGTGEPPAAPPGKPWKDTA